MGHRGELTGDVAKRAAELFGYNIDVTALRLFPYLLYELANGSEGIARIERSKINDADREWLTRWTNEDLIKWNAPHFTTTRKFYDIACELQWLAYIDIKETA